MNTKLRGTVTVLGKNIDTDQIYPGRYLAITDPKEIGRHCLEGVSPDISPNFPTDGIVVAQTNFGCGSSREHAPIALLNMGASAVIADSFARIFYRNAINLGLPLLICKGLWEHVQTGDTISVDLETGILTIEKQNKTLLCEPLSDQALMILEAGGIKPLFRKKMELE